MSKPIVLLVEDNEKARKSCAELLSLGGMVPLTVDSAEAAEKELRASPGISLLVTDVNLDPTQARDRSGVSLAKRTRELYPSLPIVGYSARFEEGDLPEGDRDLFDSRSLKGADSASKLKAKVRDWRALAEQYQMKRIDQARRELDRLVQKYKISEYDFELLREFIPAVQTVTNVVSDSPEAVLAGAGFTLKMVDGGEARRVLKDASRATKMRVSVPVWLRSGEKYVVVEVLGFPGLYASAETADEAIAQLLRLMYGYYRDLRGTLNLSEDVARLRDFLSMIFG